MGEDIHLGEVTEKFANSLFDLDETATEYVFLGRYPDLPHQFDGTDIDILVTDEKQAARTFRRHGWVIQRQGSQFPARAFLFNADDSNWIIIDLWDKKKFSYPVIGEYLLTHASKDDSDFSHPPVDGVYAWKILKYVHQGSMGNQSQLEEIRDQWQSLEAVEKNSSIELLRKSEFPNKWLPCVEQFLTGNREDLNNEILTHIEKKGKQKDRNRIVYSGDIRLEGLFRNPDVIWRLITSVRSEYEYSLPTVAVVGNDGGGKTTYCNRLLNSEFYKTDPVRISFKRKDPVLPVYRTIRPWLNQFTRSSWERYFTETQGVWNNLKFFAESIPFWLRELGDFADRYARYIIGQLWADAGLGVVIFERYSTDRLRGEYPGPANSLFPLEEYLPFPDWIIHFDVLPEDSVKRKSDDNHNLEVMTQKRESYLRLLNTIDSVTELSPEYSIYESYLISCIKLNDLCSSKQSSDLKGINWNKKEFNAQSS